MKSVQGRAGRIAREIQEFLFPNSLALGTRLLAIGAITYLVVATNAPDMLSLWAAILLGITLGLMWVVIGMVPHGNTVLEILIGSVITLVLLLILFPLFIRAKQKRMDKQQHATAIHVHR